MTRKRYIKLLMSLDIERNKAAAMAKAEREGKTPYAEAWQYINAYHKVPALADIDEMHETGGNLVERMMATGCSARPCPVVVVPGTVALNGEILNGIDFGWPPQPQPAAGCLYAIDTTPPEDTGRQWAKNDALDALRYAVEEMYNRQRGVLGR